MPKPESTQDVAHSREATQGTQLGAREPSNGMQILSGNPVPAQAGPGKVSRVEPLGDPGRVGVGQLPWLFLCWPGGPTIAGPVSLDSRALRTRGSTARVGPACPVLDAKPLRVCVGVLGEGTAARSLFGHQSARLGPGTQVHLRAGALQAPKMQPAPPPRCGVRTRLPFHKPHPHPGEGPPESLKP